AVSVFKIGSGEITIWSFLEHVARKGKPIILSTGMSFLSEVDEAVRIIRRAGCEQLVLLHCVSSYPADPADANLLAMQTMATAFGVPVGFSDHTRGIEVSLAAVALGACVIEKHFTLDRTMPGPDHQASLEPEWPVALVRRLRTVRRSAVLVVSGRRKVLFVTGIRSEYDLLHSAISAVHESPGMDVGLVVTGAHCSPMYGETAREVERDGFPIIARIENLLNSDSLAGRAKSAATQLAGLVDVLGVWRPDFVVAPLDREEAMSAGRAGSYRRVRVWE